MRDKKYFIYAAAFWIIVNLILAIKDVGKTYDPKPISWLLPFILLVYILFTMWIGYNIGKPSEDKNCEHLSEGRSKMKQGQLKVWWVPQVPMKSFDVLVDNLRQAKLLLDTLANYDLFQYENNIKPDYSNAGGLMIWDEDIDPDKNGEYWTIWYDPETGMDFDEYCKDLSEHLSEEK